MKSCCICQGYINLSKSVGKSKERGKKTIMENTNEMKIIFDSRPENEGLARVAAAAFCTQLNPTLEEVADQPIISALPFCRKSLSSAPGLHKHE